MSDHGNDQFRHESRTHMQRAVDRRAARRQRAVREGHRSVWFGLGMFGVVGWSVAVPMIVGIAIGLWIDSRTQSQRSWTLMLMVAGLCAGCFNAWAWVQREANEK